MLTSEAPLLDLKAAGGLSEALSLQIFPAPIRNAIRNSLPAPYSSFQLIRGESAAPGEPLIRQITAVVNSWKSM